MMKPHALLQTAMAAQLLVAQPAVAADKKQDAGPTGGHQYCCAVSQAAGQGAGDAATFSQIGDHGPAGVMRSAPAPAADGIANISVIDQHGSGHGGEIRQQGSSLEAVIVQEGAANGAAIDQSGSGLAARIEQSGYGQGVEIFQSGAGNSLPIVVRQ
jgi:minor curlin subunit